MCNSENSIPFDLKMTPRKKNSSKSQSWSLKSVLKFQLQICYRGPGRPPNCRERASAARSWREPAGAKWSSQMNSWQHSDQFLLLNHFCSSKDTEVITLGPYRSELKTQSPSFWLRFTSFSLGTPQALCQLSVSTLSALCQHSFRTLSALYELPYQSQPFIS